MTSLSRPLFNPCYECINSLRATLFKIKSDHCMESYTNVLTFIKDNIYDLYTGSTKVERDANPSKYNIEHTIPATILLSNRPERDNMNLLYINEEPFHDPHILFPTDKTVNSLRGHKSFAKIVSNRKEFIEKLAIDTKTLLINKNKYIGNIDNISLLANTNLIKIDDISLLGDEKDDIYLCEKTDCKFQPSQEFSGDIARVVFYTYLMYGIDPRTRPFTNNNPWLFDSRANPDMCKGFPFSLFNEFFYNNIYQYRDWAFNDPISPIERAKNKSLIDRFVVPNIFIGFSDKRKCESSCSADKISSDVFYTDSDMTIIDDLFFGRTHDHNKYKGIIFVSKQPPLITRTIEYTDYAINNLKNINCVNKINSFNNIGVSAKLDTSKLSVLSSINPIYILPTTKPLSPSSILQILNDDGTPIIISKPKPLKKLSAKAPEFVPQFGGADYFRYLKYKYKYLAIKKY